MIRSSLYIGAGLAAMSLASISSAAITVGSVTPTKANGQMIPGNGIFANDFTIDTAGTGEQVALKARDRQTGQALSHVGNTYFVSAGNDPSASNRAAWNFDFQFTPAAGKVQADYTYEIKADIDPGVGTTNFVTFDPIALGDSVFTNPGGGAWSDNTTPFVIANSTNYKFGFLGGPSFANAAYAEYDILFTVRDAESNVVASSGIVAAVPEPTSLALLGLGAGALLLRRRRLA